MVGSRRYNTGDELDLVGWLNRLNARVSALENGNRAGFTAVDRGAFVIKEGNFRVVDNRDDTIVELGKGPGSDYGLRLLDDQGDTIVELGKESDTDYGLRLLDDQGDTIVELGKRPNNDYGLRLLDDKGNTIVELGKRSGSEYGLRLIDDDGNVIARFDRGVGGRQAITFLDNAGNVKAELGKLSNGQYGIAVINGSELADLGNLVFGMRTATVTAVQATTSTTYTDLLTPGPEVTVTVGQSGKVEVTLSAWMQVDVGFSGNTVGGGMMAFRVDDGATRAESDVEALYCRLNASTAGAVSLEMGFSRTVIVEGLPPGPHKFTARYKMVSGGSFVSFSNRHIIVKPL